MAERRRTGGSAPVRPRARRPARPGEQEVVEEEAPDTARRDEREVFDEDAAEPAGRDDDEGDRSRQARRAGSSLTAKEAVRDALRQIVELTGKQAESITEVERTDDGWKVGIEVVEDHRIPSSADILATYDARIDGDGELMSCRRVRRYSRGRGDCS